MGIADLGATRSPRPFSVSKSPKAVEFIPEPAALAVEQQAQTDFPRRDTLQLYLREIGQVKLLARVKK